MRKLLDSSPENSFKLAVERDIEDTFLNISEFSDWHDIDGAVVNCLIDTNLTDKHPVDSYEGVFRNTVRIHVLARDMERPVEGELIRIDGSLHFVQSVSDEMGMYVITAVENQQ